MSKHYDFEEGVAYIYPKDDDELEIIVESVDSDCTKAHGEFVVEIGDIVFTEDFTYNGKKYTKGDSLYDNKEVLEQSGETLASIEDEIKEYIVEMAGVYEE